MQNEARKGKLVDPIEKFTFRQPVNIDVRDVADRAGTTVNGLLRVALIEYMKRNGLTS